MTALLAWCGEHSREEVHSVLELAAGPAEHALELARRGLRATALDKSAAMCGFAAARAEGAGLDLGVVEADMRDFKLPDRFDLAITMLNSLCHLFTLDDLLAHLAAVAAHLRPGGLYIAELAHPADYFAPVPRTSSEWTIDQEGVRAEVRWGGGQDRIDPVTQITREHMSITAHDADGTVRTVGDVVPNRFWTATELTAALRLDGQLHGRGQLRRLRRQHGAGRPGRVADDPRPPPRLAEPAAPHAPRQPGTYSTGISLLIRDRSMPCRARTVRATRKIASASTYIAPM